MIVIAAVTLEKVENSNINPIFFKKKIIFANPGKEYLDNSPRHPPNE